MKQNDKNRKALIQYRIEQAKTTVGTVKFEKDEVLQLFDDMKDFIKTIDEYLNDNK